MYSATTLTEEEAEDIAVAYYRASKNPRNIGAILAVDRFDIGLLSHPFVKRKIAEKARAMRTVYTLENHLDKLKEIRDAALEDGNHKVALTAEISVGKAAGLYETIPVSEEVSSTASPIQLTTDEIRKRLAAMGTVALPSAIPHTDFQEDEGLA